MNQLQHEKSPYLLQHAENPVDWQPWGQAAFDAAQTEDKPIFLSIGYSTCHWCHVMAHESFEDGAVAAALNGGFIPVKVDREERPDVDAVYMAACVAMNGSGGWPLTVLLTPERKPFWAGTYLPKAQLLSLLEQAETLWREEREGVLSAGEALTEKLRQEREFAPGSPRRELVETGAAKLARRFDSEWGGFSRAPKFPTPHNILFLLRCARLTENASLRRMGEETLEHIYRGGLFDHVGGGFCRYATDRRWLVPHFEKMLYDNALLALAYTEAWEHTRRDYTRDVVRRTLDYVLAELTDPLGGFYCGQDADSAGGEGAYYLLTPGELETVLGRTEAEAFCRRFGITAAGNFEGKSIPNLIETLDWEREPAGMDALRESVRRYRKGRTALRRDDKVLAGWNGLMLAALARAGLALDEPRYIEAAARAAAFIRRYMTDENGGLLARWREGEAAHPGKLEDYAFTAWGLLELYGATFDTAYLEEAMARADVLLEKFFDREQGGFYPYASDGEQLIARTRETYDGALPSGNSAAALVLSRLGRITGEARWRDAAALQLRYMAGAVEDYPAGHSFALLTLLEELWPSGELVIAARELPGEFLDFLRKEPRLNLTVLLKTPENEARLAAAAPFTADYPVPEAGARYYLCRNGACGRPVDAAADLERLL